MANYLSTYSGAKLDTAISDIISRDTTVTDAQADRDTALSYSDTSADHSANAAAGTSAAAATAAGIAGFDLDAIAQTKGVTMVAGCISVFKMPLWLQMPTSWYRETLNTATRGARQDMPTTLVVIATATSVTLYDGDDPTLPMWMVFNQGFKYAIHNGAPVTFVSCSNGLLLVGCASGGSGSLAEINLAADMSVMRTTLTTGYYVRKSLTLRNTAVDAEVVGYFSAGLVNRDINSIAMTVLPGAPIDPRTGIAIPTIAVGTAGGVSVIQNSGAVTDSNLTLGVSMVAFDQDGGLLYGRKIATYGLYHATLEDHLAGDGFGDHIANTATSAGKMDLRVGSRKFAVSGRTIYVGDSVKSANANPGLVAIDLNPADRADSLNALITADFNTGWMRDPAGVFLCSTDTTSLTAAEQLTNGDFSVGTGWTAGGSWTISGGVAMQPAGASANYLTHSPAPLVVGKTYKYSIEVVSGNGSNFAQVYNQAIVASLVSGPGVYTGTFVAVDTSFKIRAVSPTMDVVVDNVSVQLADADRSVNNNGLSVNGTITRTPVASGAEKVGYGGWSASNYLEQPYNSDLDYGTGDFTIMGWVNPTVDALRYFYERFSAGGGNLARVRVYRDASGFMNANIWDAVSGTVTATATHTSPVNAWSMFAVVRESGVLKVYVNGVLSGSVASTHDLTSPSGDHILRFGVRSDLATAFDGYLADITPEPTAWSAADIAKKYRDELPNFQPGAQCTLYGTSDAVTAVAHDEVTGLIHAGTSAGRSVFDDLTRVANTTNPITTAIAAHDGLVLEQ